MPEKTPIKHIAFILDGNRRWATREGLSSLEGHKAGYKNLKVIAQECFDKGIKYFSCYLFSNENWQRSQEEVGYLMNLALRVVLKDAKELNSKNVKLKIIGSRLGLDKKLLQAIEKAEELTADNTAGTLVACFNYGGQQEIVEATKSIVSSGLPVEDITEETIKSHLYSKDIPAPDLIIRTSGEQRLSNFLLWDSAYAELFFVKKYWPEFSPSDLDEVLKDYYGRVRRFGS